MQYFQCHYLEVTSQDLGAFTRGIDSPQLQLLCRSSDTSIPLDDIQWTSRLDTSLSIPNPFIVSTLSSGIRYLKCNRGNTPFNYAILVQGNSKHISNEIYFERYILVNSIFTYRTSYPNYYRYIQYKLYTATS